MGTPWEIADQASRMLAEAQQARRDIRDLLAELARQREDAASVALWCSLGEHAFSNHDRKRATFTVETFDEDGKAVRETHVSCGQCAAKRRAALEARPAIPTGADAELYRQYLEWRNGMAPEPGIPGEGTAADTP